MHNFLNKTISLKSLALFALSALVLVVVLLATSKDEIILAARYVRDFDSKEIDTRIKMQLDRIKYDVLALNDPNPSEFPEMDLRIAPSDLRKIDVYVKQIGSAGSLQQGIEKKKKWSPVIVTQDGDKYSARIRIRGNQATHWINKKKSWRIKFKKEKLLQRRRSIHLIIIKDKLMEIEEAAYQVARKRGLFVPDSGFTTVRQNNVDMGLYFWTEHLDKYQLERRELPGGEIFAGDDAHLEKIFSTAKATGRPPVFGLNPAVYKTLIHKKGAVAQGAQKHWHNFLALLATGDSKKINSEIENFLNIEKFAIWNSLLFVFNSSHAQSVDNLSWFYDPTSGLFEPILWDISLGRSNPMSLEQEFYNPVVTGILSSKKVREQRNKALFKLAHEDGDEILSTLSEVYQSIEPYLYRGVEPIDQDLPTKGNQSLKQQFFTHADRYNMVKKNIAGIEEWLTQQRVFGTSSFQTHDRGGLLKVELVPEGISSINLKSIEIEPNVRFSQNHTDIKFRLFSSKGEVKDLKPSSSELDAEKWYFLFSDVKLILPRFGNLTSKEEERETWVLTVNIEGDENPFIETGNIPALIKPVFENAITGKEIHEGFVRVTKVALQNSTGLAFTETKATDTVFEKVSSTDVTAKGAESKLDIFLADTQLPFRVEGGKLILPSGRYNIHQNVIVPRGYGLVFEPGVQWSMGPNINVLTYDPVEFRGTVENPIVIDRIDAGSAWGIFGVVSAQGTSVLNHVKVSGGGAGTQTSFNGMFFTGQLNFFNSNVEINNSQILNSEGEDGLNIKKARFIITNSVFSGNGSDAFDGDWVTGTVLSSQFLDNGNDGLDFSGSKVVVVDTLLSGSGDKAISAGEQSQVDIINSRMENSEYGITSKDLSRVRVYASSIRGNKYGVAAYRKKPLFGGGIAEIHGGLIWQNEEDFFIDSSSKAFLNGVAIENAPNIRTVESEDLRVGPIENIFRLDQEGNPVSVFTSVSQPAYRAGPETSGKTITGEDLPDLSKYPVGMLYPLGSLQ